MPGDDVVLVTTTGSGSMDRYGRRLAEHLPVAVEECDSRRIGSGAFGIPLLSAGSLRRAAGDVRLVRRLRARPGTLLHLTHHHLARYGPALRRPYVVTAHDTIRWHDLTAGPGEQVHIARPRVRDRLLLRRDYAGFRAASALVAPSEATRRDLVTQLGVRPGAVHVVPLGLDHAVFRPVPRRLHAGRYLLVVGSEHPRKNLASALQAFALLKRDPAAADLRLVKVGASGDGVEARFREPTLRVVAELGLEREVLFTEEVPLPDLVGWYSGAACVLMPSRCEGFGLPPVEAMACGAPVVVSTAGSLPEVSGGAALTVPPDDVAGLAAAVGAVLADDALRGRLVAAGLARAATFTWERTARETAAVHASVVAALPSGVTGARA